MGFLLPLGAFIFGLFIAQAKDIITDQIKTTLSSLLAKFFIPAVIVYNLVFYQAGSLSLILYSFLSCIFLYYIYKIITKNQLNALCLSYTNMAWLGFPFAMALFGPSVSAAMVALYIGGSIFGNSWAVAALSTEQESWWNIVKKVFKSPPVIAIILALICRLMGLQNLSEHQWIDWIYSFAKIGMIFSGMCVLGIWLRRTRVHFSDVLKSIQMAVFKVSCGAIICSLVYFFVPIPHLDQYIGAMFLIFCLPPAANIVALETYYQGTGESAKTIAAGTMVSCVIVCIFAVILHFI